MEGTVAKSQVTESDLGVSARIKQKKAKKSDFYISSINIEPAENGLTVRCSYCMKPEIQAANRKKEVYCSDYLPDEKFVFEDYKGVTDFLTKKIGEIAAEEKTESGSY